VHADIKPANILLHQDNSENSTVKIADFGVSQKMNKEDDGTFSKALMKDLSGTRLYMAPELKKANTLVGPEIDMWSFGVLLYQMCVGYLPT
jgi:serine/threonine protein kinase